MLVCNVSMRPPRRAVAADLAEIAAANDAVGSGNIVFATLVDDPAAVLDVVDAYFGEIMLEAASATDTPDAGLAFGGDIVESVTASEAHDGAVSHDVAPPLDGTSPTAAWSVSRKLLTSYGGSYYTDISGAITTLYDQAGSGRNFTDSGGATRRPTLTTAGPNSRAAADFNGTTNFLTSSALSNFITSGSGFMVFSAIVTAISTNNSTSYSNDALIEDQSQYAGLYLRSLAGGTVLAFNYDGGDKHADTTFSTGVPVVFTWRHEGGNVYVSVNGGSEVSAASGNTGSLAAAIRLCGGMVSNTDATVFELATWSTVPGATTRAAIVADFKAYIGA